MPPRIAVCRCGTHAPATPLAPSSATDVEVDDAPESGTSRTLGTVTLLALLLAASAWVWTSVTRPPVVVATDDQPAAAPPAPTEPGPPTEIALSSENMNPNVAATPAAPAATATAAPPALEDVIAHATGAVVMVETAESRGTGFFVKADTLVTNQHVVRNATSVTIRLSDGTTRAAQVERTVPTVDLAVLRTAMPTTAPPVLTLGRVEQVRVGQEVIAIGSALGLQSTVTRGIISAVRQSGTIALLQTDAAINPGNSGGPLLDRSGTVIGVTTLKAGGPAEGLGFAVAADHARALIDGQSTNAVETAVPMAAAAPTTPVIAFGAPTPQGGPDRASQLAAYDRSLGEASDYASQIDDQWARFKAACAPQPSSEGDREWLPLAERGVEMHGRDRNCPQWLSDLQRMSREFAAGMRRIGDAARRAGLPSDALRDLRKRRRLDWVGY